MIAAADHPTPEGEPLLNMKDTIRKILQWMHLDVTKNLQYDRLTKVILKKSLSENSNCIDVGCHKGEILEIILGLAPDGTHFAFEPIPDLYNLLVQEYGEKVNVLPYALADSEGTTIFHYVKNAPAYSGINQRRYDIADPEIEELTVEQKTLDQVIPGNLKIDLVKIDVEGAELGVLKGALQLLGRWHPIVIFECGLGASDFYGTEPEDVYDLLCRESGYWINTLKRYLKKENPLSREQFVKLYRRNSEYYFIAFQ